MDNFIRELEGQFPSKDTVYEYYIDVKQKFWVLWEDKLRSGLVFLGNVSGMITVSSVKIFLECSCPTLSKHMLKRFSLLIKNIYFVAQVIF